MLCCLQPQLLLIYLCCQVEVSKSGCLDFGDLPAGGAKSLPLKLLNRTPSTVPIRLVISAVSLCPIYLYVIGPMFKTT